MGGSVEFAGEDLMQKSPRQMRRIRGRDMAIILQDPMVSLNPLFSILPSQPTSTWDCGASPCDSGRQVITDGAHPFARDAHA